MSTYEGSLWLPELLASVQSQSHEDWSLLIRDDGSADQTPTLLAAAAAADSRIEVIRDDLGRLGPSASFMLLLGHVDSGLFAFCDQDDIWLPHKLEVSIAALGSAPVAAVYTDVEVTDARGRTTSTSALDDRGVGGPIPFGHLLVNNVAIGATVLGTAELARATVALSQGRPVLMHDWWTALVAAHQGSLVQIPVPTLRWRRHDDTVTGTTPPGLRARARRRREYLRWSIDAAQRLREAPPGCSPEATRAVAALCSVDPERPTARALLRAWRTGDVRAWPRRGQVLLLLSVVTGRTDQ